MQEICPTLAQELTAMLFGVDNAEVIHLLESKESLRATMNEYDDCCTTTVGMRLGEGTANVLQLTR